jgi:alkylated DNA repair dioxygenase AlkB
MNRRTGMQPAAQPPPHGWRYEESFLAAKEEAQLLDEIGSLPFHEAPYREWTAKRRIVSYGGRYDFGRNELAPAPPIPDFLHALRARVAAWSALAPELLSHATVTEYRPGTQLGWHRDVPEFEEVAGVSLLGFARMRFRPYPPEKGQRGVFSLELAPRSVYLMSGAVRWRWQHAISPTTELRYSITFRSRRAVPAAARTVLGA